MSKLKPIRPQPLGQIGALTFTDPIKAALSFLGASPTPGSLPIWYELPGSVYLQANTQNITYVTGGLLVSYQRPFPTATLVLIPIANDNNLGAVVWSNAFTTTKSAFGIKCYGTAGTELGNGSVVRIAYLAIGN